MSTDITNQTAEISPRDRLRGIMDALKGQIAETLPKHLDADTMTRIVLIEGTRNPDLRLCTPTSLASSIMLASQLGLQCSSPLGHFYLVPRREKIDPRNRNSRKEWRCGFVIGYRGYVELARRAGLRINAGCVYATELERDLFSWTNEPPALEHKGGTGIDRNDSALTLAYAVAVDERRGRAGHRWQIVLDRDTLDKARQLAGTDRIWAKHLDAMARKTAIRRLLSGGLVPLSPELEHAVQAERAAELAQAEIIEAAELGDPPIDPAQDVDPLRAALELAPPSTDADPAADPAALANAAAKLEGELEQEQIIKAVKKAGRGLVLDPDRDLADSDPAALARYVAALEAST